MSVEVIPGIKTDLGEGPHWEDDKQSLLFVDCIGDLLRLSLDTKELKTLRLSNIVGSVVPCEAGGYLAGVGRTISHVNWETKEISTQAEVESIGTDDQLNDGKCCPSGRFWTGTMSKEVKDYSTYEHMNGVLYHLDLDGEVHRHIDNLEVSNGMAWTADGRTMFYTDSLPKKIFAFDYDVNLGTISNQRVAVDFTKFDDCDTMGYPDGMTIDTNDNLWVTCFDSGKVVCFDPKTGLRLRTVKLPVTHTTSCCFGGKNLDEMFVTSAAYFASTEEMATCSSVGGLFKITGLGAKGRPANIFKGKIKNKKYNPVA